jgi:predicted Zn-dependent peptidase
MAELATSHAANGLPIHRIGVHGTRALTALVAFDAGARSEQPQENGVAHFLEHLVFKGGERYPHYRDVNETAERMGAMINAYTSHDLVAFHITCRAEVAAPAIDLVTDIAGRPRVDPEELERERGVVIQEIARANDQPATVAGHLIEQAAFGDHPLGRPVLGPEEHLREFTREQILAFRARRWSPARGGAFLVGNTDHVPGDDQLAELFGRFPSSPDPPPYEAAPPFAPGTLVEARETNQSHLRMLYRPAIDPHNQRQRAALGIYATLLGGSMGSRLFDEIREQRGLCYSVWAHAHAYADTPALSLGSGLDSAKCLEAYARMREIVDDLRGNGPRPEEVERARAYAGGRLVLAFEDSGSVARHAAQQSIVYGGEVDPDAAIEAVDSVTFDEVDEVARGISEELAVACVGPHAAADF